MDGSNRSDKSNAISWFASNPVAANLLVVLVLFLGTLTTFSIRKQVTPDPQITRVEVEVDYPGATPVDIEQSVILKIEEAVHDIPGVVAIDSHAQFGRGTVEIEVAPDVDIDQSLAEIKNRIDAIPTFPVESEPPIVRKKLMPVHVLFLSIYGQLNEFERKTLGEIIRRDLLSLADIEQVQILGDLDYEINVEVAQSTLYEYELTLADIAALIRANSIDVPAGTLVGEDGQRAVRIDSERRSGLELGETVIRAYPDGVTTRLDQISNIRDAFEETEGFNRFNGYPTVTMRVLAIGQKNELASAAAVKAYLDERMLSLPSDIQVEVWVDRARGLKARLLTLVTNLIQGGLIILALLTLFFSVGTTFWIVAGVPFAFLGAVWLMPHGPWPVTINETSVFAFILALGLIVDDSLIVAESVQRSVKKHGLEFRSVVNGACAVAVPSAFGILTTIAAFVPMLFIAGPIAPFFQAIAVVVILCLSFSLIESKLVLPAHIYFGGRLARLAKAKIDSYRRAASSRVSDGATGNRGKIGDRLLDYLNNCYFERVLRQAIENRFLTFSVFGISLLLSLAVVKSPVLEVLLFPNIERDLIEVNLEMEGGTAARRRNEVLASIEQAGLSLAGNLTAEAPRIRMLNVFTRGENRGVAYAELPLGHDRTFGVDEVVRTWRERIPDNPGIKELHFSSSEEIGRVPRLSYRLYGRDSEALRSAAAEIEHRLASYPGVFNVRNTTRSGGQAVEVRLRPEGVSLGLTHESVGAQVRDALVGAEARRIYEEANEIKVRVRLPQDERESVVDIENYPITTAAGDLVPLSSVVEIVDVDPALEIERFDRRQFVEVSADVDTKAGSAAKVSAEMSGEHIPEILSRHHGVSEGRSRASIEEQRLSSNLSIAIAISLVLVYTLLAIPSKSYIQPLVVMAVIPFSIIGAVVGHLLLDQVVTVFSMIGLVALSGVVVNDSLLIVHRYNAAVKDGRTSIEAAVSAATARFRAIVLTSLTTCLTLVPLIVEGNPHSEYLKPMAVTISFGILVGTAVSLILVPMLLVTVADLLSRVVPEQVGQERLES